MDDVARGFLFGAGLTLCVALAGMAIAGVGWFAMTVAEARRRKRKRREE